MEEWSLTQAEANHVETIEEANDFHLPEEDGDDFFEKATVYEMHDQAEQNLQLFQDEELRLQQEAEAESNETETPGDQTPPITEHDQSAPDESKPASNPPS